MTFFFVLFCGLSKTQFYFLSSKGEWKACYCWTILKVFHLYLCDFHPFHDGKFSSHALRIFMFAVRYHHCCNVSWAQQNIILYVIIHALSLALTYTRVDELLLQDRPIFYSMIWFIRVSYERKILFARSLAFSDSPYCCFAQFSCVFSS